MIHSENTLTHAFKSFSEQIIHITIVYEKEFSPREPKCLNGVAAGNCDGQHL